MMIIHKTITMVIIMRFNTSMVRVDDITVKPWDISYRAMTVAVEIVIGRLTIKS